MRERKSKYIKEGPYGVVDPRRVGGGEGIRGTYRNDSTIDVDSVRG